jgi:O-methyltransferase
VLPTEFYKDAAGGGGAFEGQLDDEFQKRLADEHANVALEQCDFYHTMVWPDGSVQPGVWDLRGRERSYLGWVDVAGRRVLEVGPATGYLSFHMEKMGADVVCFDLPPATPPDVIPQEGHDLDAHRRLGVEYMERVRNSWWYSRRRLGARCRPVYGDIYRLPSDLRRFDVATLSSVLMHLSNPFAALRQAAILTDKAVIVTEPIARVPADPEAAYLEFAPMGTHDTVVVWWQTTPGVLMKMLRVCGFLEFSLYYHVQTYHPRHEMDKPPVEALFFTLVAERHAGWAPRLAMTAAERATEAEVRKAWSTKAADASALQAELEGLQRSWSWRLTRPVRAVGSLLRRAGLR